MWEAERDKRRTLENTDRKALYIRADGKCESCGQQIEFIDMEPGHRIKAWVKGGKTNIENSACLCHRCNVMQSTGTGTLNQLRKKLGKGPIEPESHKIKKALKELTLTQLKYIAKVNKIKVKSKTNSDLFPSYIITPTKSAYVKTLSKLKLDQINSDLKGMPKPVPKKKKRKNYNNIPF